MEVHHHSHTSRKKWAHYFWEFLMLFLAVFCGFLAEYKLEHMIEHQREKQFIQSLRGDVTLDTADLTRIHNLRLSRGSMLDSLTLLLNGPEPASHMNRIYYFARHIQRLFPLNFTYNDGTIQQLKNSGTLRLIRNRKAASAIIRYDAVVRDMEIIEEREYQYLYLCLPVMYKIFDAGIFEGMDDSLMNIYVPKGVVNLSRNADAAMPEFNASLYSLKIANFANRKRTKILIGEGEKLLNILNEEYRLE
ncbi:MAG TPA: hypothetical protein VF144_05465 [Chitinophagaceae bacterium]